MAIEAGLAVAVRGELEKVLASTGFARNERLSRFLRFLVEQQLDGRGAELKESVIAIEVFGRKPDYDPKLDAIVRTEAVRLRARLSAYYTGEGREDSLVIELPKGGYRPLFRPAAAVEDFRDRQMQHKAPAARRLLAGAAIVLVAAATSAGWWWFRQRTAPATIAVLPLENLGHEPATDYFADGLTDEIIRSLSVVEGLTVRSRTSSFALKGKPANAREAGSTLAVDYILEGSVLHKGEQLRVNAQLVRVRDDYPLWSARFDRELTDVFAIQDEVARGIVDSLRLKLGSGRRRYESNLEAYDLYLRGRQVMEGFPSRARPIALPAIQYFEQAIAKDGSYALAYAGIADAALAIDENTVNPDMYARARKAAQKSVELDPMLSEAQSAAAAIRARGYAWQDAERGFRLAIQLNPNNSLAHLRLGIPVLIVQEHFDEALQEVRRAVALDPLSPFTNTEFAHALLLAGRYKEAIDQARKAIALDPSRNRGYVVLRRALYLQGNAADALTPIDRTRVAAEAGTPGPWLVCANMRAGRRNEATTILDGILARSNAAAIRSLAPAYACLDDRARAVESLEDALAAQDGGLALIVQSPEFASMRTDPAFAAFRQKLNLPN